MSKKHILVILLVLAIILSFVSCSQPSQMDEKVKAMFEEAQGAIESIIDPKEEDTEGLTIKDDKIIVKDYVYHLGNKEYKMNGFISVITKEINFKFNPKLPLGCESISNVSNEKPLPNEKKIITINNKEYYIPVINNQNR